MDFISISKVDCDPLGAWELKSQMQAVRSPLNLGRTKIRGVGWGVTSND